VPAVVKCRVASHSELSCVTVVNESVNSIEECDTARDDVVGSATA
jgi:hypothetical protein